MPPIRSLRINWSAPPSSASRPARPANVPAPTDLKRALAELKSSSLKGVMDFAVGAVRQHQHRDVSALMRDVQERLSLPDARQLSLLSGTAELLAKQTDHQKEAMDLLEGMTVSNLHTLAELRPAFSALVSRLAGEVHGHDLDFVLRATREVPGATIGVSKLGQASAPALKARLDGAESVRTALEAGDTQLFRRLANQDTGAIKRDIHDGYLWAKFILRPDLETSARSAHQRLFPAYRFPHDVVEPGAASYAEDGFVRQR